MKRMRLKAKVLALVQLGGNPATVSYTDDLEIEHGGWRMEDGRERNVKHCNAIPHPRSSILQTLGALTPTCTSAFPGDLLGHEGGWQSIRKPHSALSTQHL